MNRVTTLLVCCVIVAASVLLVGFAAFLRQERQYGPWFDGWNKPVDPVGGCRFDRQGDRLTITVPGAGHGLYYTEGPPHLLRIVEGDFVVQVRVGGNFGHDPTGISRAGPGAGICVTDGHWFVTLRRVSSLGESASSRIIAISFQGEEGGEQARLLSLKHPNQALGPSKEVASYISDEPVGYMRLHRRGHRLEAETSDDGKEWTKLDSYLEIRLPTTLSVGVLAETTFAGTFKAEFDQFKLTSLGGKTQ